MYKMIEKLKKPELAQPHCLRSFEEQKFLESINPDHLVFLNLQGDWVDWPGGPRCVRDTVILKPDYQPEPEYEDWEVFLSTKDKLCVRHPVRDRNILIGEVANEPGFACFHYMDGAETTNDGQVPNWLRANPSQTIYARFVRSKP